MGLKSWLYRLGLIMGDVNAVKKHRVSKRIGRRLVGKITGRALFRLFK